eukprot:2310226-Alexandrium_andersonii.AAC.1
MWPQRRPPGTHKQHSWTRCNTGSALAGRPTGDLGTPCLLGACGDTLRRCAVEARCGGALWRRAVEAR